MFFSKSVIIKALMSHFLHSLKAIVLVYLRSRSVTWVSNGLKISFMVANNRSSAVQTMHMGLCTYKSKRIKKIQNSNTVQVRIQYNILVLYNALFNDSLQCCCFRARSAMLLCTDVKVQNFFCTAVPACCKKLLHSFCSLICSGDQLKTTSNSLTDHKWYVNTAWTLLVE